MCRDTEIPTPGLDQRDKTPPKMWPLLAFLQRRGRRRNRRDRDTDRPERGGPMFDFPTVTLQSGGRAREESFSPGQGDGANQQQHQHNTNNSSTTMPLLYTLARSWAWTAVAFRASTHPHEASTAVVDHRGDNVLHWTVFGNPTVQVVQALLQVCPALARQPNLQGLYPLHASVIQLLVEAYPVAAGLPNRMGSYPLHLMCDYGTTPTALRAVLQHAEAVPSVTQLDPVYQRRPVHILNGRKNMVTCQRTRNTLRTLRHKLRRAQQQQQRQRQQRLHNHVADNGNDDADDSITKLQTQFRDLLQEPQNDWYVMASMLLVVEATQQPLPAEEEQESLAILRAVMITNDCPASFQEWAILRYADYLHLPLCAVPKDDGRLALHMAVSTSSHRPHMDTGLVLDLVEACPAAAGIRDAQGNLPLHIALQQRWRRRQEEDSDNRTNQHYYYHSHEDVNDNTVVWALIHAYPEAITEIELLDQVPSLIPYLWSRLTTRDALFRIIRATGTTNPHLFAKDQ